MCRRSLFIEPLSSLSCLFSSFDFAVLFTITYGSLCSFYNVGILFLSTESFSFLLSFFFFRTSLVLILIVFQDGRVDVNPEELVRKFLHWSVVSTTLDVESQFTNCEKQKTIIDPTVKVTDVVYGRPTYTTLSLECLLFLYVSSRIKRSPTLLNTSTKTELWLKSLCRRTEENYH